MIEDLYSFIVKVFDLLFQSSSLSFVKCPMLVIQSVLKGVSFRLSLWGILSETIGKSSVPESRILRVFKAFHCLLIVTSLEHLNALGSPSLSLGLYVLLIFGWLLFAALGSFSKLIKKLPLLIWKIWLGNRTLWLLNEILRDHINRIKLQPVLHCVLSSARVFVIDD